MNTEPPLAKDLGLGDCTAQLEVGPSSLNLDLFVQDSDHLAALHEQLPETIRRLRSILSSTGCTMPLWVTIFIEEDILEKNLSKATGFEADQDIARGEFVIDHRPWPKNGTTQKEPDPSHITDPIFKLPGGNLIKEPLTSAAYLEELRDTLAAERKETNGASSSAQKTKHLRHRLYEQTLRFWSKPIAFPEGLKAWREEITSVQVAESAPTKTKAKPRSHQPTAPRAKKK